MKAMRLTSSVQPFSDAILRSTCVDDVLKALVEAHMVSNHQHQELVKKAVPRVKVSRACVLCSDELCKHTTLYMCCGLSIGELTKLIKTSLQ
jgi:hypothetical protein